MIEAALKIIGRERLAVVSSFGTESAALLKVMADVDPAIPVIFLDTGWLFEETLAYRDTLIEVLGLRDVRSIEPLEETLSRRGSGPRPVVLRSRCLLPDPQSGAARARAGAVLGLDQRAQALSGRARARDLPVVEEDGIRLKFNPFANVSRERIEAIYRVGEAAAASACRVRLPVGRLHALHQPRAPRRRRPRRALARQSQDRMRHSHDEDFVAQCRCPAANIEMRFR